VTLSTCSADDLVAAIEAANDSGEPIVVRLAEHCTYTLEAAHNVDKSIGANGLPVIVGDVTIDGRGAAITCDNGFPPFRIFQVVSTGTLHLQNVTLGNGRTTRGPLYGNPGGCIYNSGGALIVSDSTITGCATSDGFGAGGAGDGGAIYNAGGSVTLTRTVITGNRTGGREVPFESSIGLGGYGGDGAGIFNAFGTITLVDSTVTENTAGNGHRPAYLGGSGGGIANNSGTVTLMRTTVSKNRTGDGGEGGLGSRGGSGGRGGGIFNLGTLIVVDSTIADNTGGTGGFGNNPTGTSGGSGGSGGGLDNAGSAIIVNSTISGNHAGAPGSPSGGEGVGGGVYNTGHAELRSVTVAENDGVGSGLRVGPGDVQIANSIVAGNAGDTDCTSPPGSLGSEGYNLIGKSDGCNLSAATGDLIGTSVDPIDPQLGQLQANGGATFTHALSPGSPAIDAGDPAGCTDAATAPLAKDQRGEPRVADGNGDGQAICDIGAFEVEAQ
jgi:hypothetical protein